MTVYDVSQVRSLLTLRITRDGYRQVAADFRVTESYLRQVLSAAKTPGPAILAGLGLAKAYTDAPPTPSSSQP